MGVIAGTPAPDNETAVPGDGVDLVNPDLVDGFGDPRPTLLLRLRRQRAVARPRAGQRAARRPRPRRAGSSTRASMPTSRRSPATRRARSNGSPTTIRWWSSSGPPSSIPTSLSGATSSPATRAGGRRSCRRLRGVKRPDLGRAAASLLLVGSALPARGESPPADPLVGELVGRHGEPQRARIERRSRPGRRALARRGRRPRRDEFCATQFAGDAARSTRSSRGSRRARAARRPLIEIGRELALEADLEPRADPPVRRDARRLRSLGARDGRSVRQQGRLRRAAQLPADHARGAPAGRRPWSRRQWAEARLAQRFDKRIPADVAARDRARPAPRPTSTSRATTCGCTTCSSEKGERLFPPQAAAAQPLEPARRAQGRATATADGLAEAAHDPRSWSASSRRRSRGRDRQPARRLEPGRPTGSRRPRRDDESRPARPPADPERSAPSRHALRHAPGELPGRAARRSVLADRADADRAPLRRGPRRSPRRACARCSRRCSPRRCVPRVATLIERASAGRSSRSTSGTTVSGRRRRAPRRSSTRSCASAIRPPRRSRADLPRPAARARLPPPSGRDYLAENIVGRPVARLGPRARARSGAPTDPHLRTRVEPDGMDYKGFNIAVHELGHNVEQIFSLYDVDHTLLAGVPNTAFTEALAFVFQAHDLELLGLAAPTAESRALEVARPTSGTTYEIAGLGARRHRRVALDVRPPGRDAGRAPRRGGRDREATSGTATTPRSSAKRDVRSSAIYAHMVHQLHLPRPTTRSAT